jgi:hypothetical protein
VPKTKSKDISPRGFCFVLKTNHKSLDRHSLTQNPVKQLKNFVNLPSKTSRSETMRLSLQLIACFFLFKSFASVQAFEGEGFAWYNDAAKPNACDLNEGSIVNAAVETAFQTAEGKKAETTTWTLASYSFDMDRNRQLRQGGRDLACGCSAWCCNRCKNTPYLCYGACAGCFRRRELTDAVGDIAVQPRRELPNINYQAVCESTVRDFYKNPKIGKSCSRAVKNAICEIH